MDQVAKRGNSAAWQPSSRMVTSRVIWEVLDHEDLMVWKLR